MSNKPQLNPSVQPFNPFGAAPNGIRVLGMPKPETALGGPPTPFQVAIPPNETAPSASRRLVLPSLAKQSAKVEPKYPFTFDAPSLDGLRNQPPTTKPAETTQSTKVPETPSKPATYVPERKAWDDPPKVSESGDATSDEDNQLTKSSYGVSTRRLMDVLTELHSTGVQHEIDLPQIAVIGSQSVGKSSLIESIAGIKLPRDSGTCTRCPMEIRLQDAKNWSCQVVLRLHAQDDGKPLESTREIKFGETITDKALVRDHIRRAQRAILDPTTNSSEYLQDKIPDKTPQGKQPLSFSFNCVCVRVAGPGVPELYFYDLPGVIANVQDGGDENDIERTKQIALQYIKRRNCLILLAISCETDFENQSAGRLVLLDPELRAKTVGVLTKADRIEAGTSNKWMNMVEGKENALAMKWFVVKLPSPNELQEGISWEESRTKESDFFSQTKPWSSMSGVRREQLGSQPLSKKLGEHLRNLISKELPGIKSDILERLNDVDKQLSAMPRPVTDAHQQVSDLLTEFSLEMSSHIRGKWRSEAEATPGLIQALRDVYFKMSKAVKDTAPCMRPWIKGQTKVSDDELRRYASRVESDGGANGDVYYLNEVLDLAAESRTRELPGNIPFDLKAHLIQSSVEKWQDITHHCFDQAKAIVSERVNMVIPVYFSQYSYNGLLDTVVMHSQQFLQELGSKTRSQLLNLFELEKTPNTLNDHYLQDYKRKMTAKYDEIYQKSQEGLPSTSSASGGTIDSEEAINKAFQLLKGQPGFEHLTPRDLKTLKSSDNDAKLGIEIMSVRAYFQVAYKRFEDNVMQQIDRTLVLEFGEKLRHELFERLGIFKDDARQTCAQWLTEDPVSAERRKDLMSRQSKLNAAALKLERIAV